MNVSSIFGVVAGMVVLFVAVVSSSKSVHVFLDFHGILVVFGGTAAAGLISFPLRFYVRVSRALISKFLGNYITQCETVIREVIDLARGQKDNPEYFSQKVATLKTPFLKDAVELLVKGGIPQDSLDAILVKRAATYSKRYEYDVAVVKTVAKFPPAFGLMGTTLGMISLLQNLGGGDAQKMLGPSMAIGLVATFYGIVLANLVFIPISENLTMINREDETIRMIVIDGLRLIYRGEHPSIIEEHLKSYLMPGERALIKKAK